MLTVGLIGPTGAGKSVVAGTLEALGAEVIRADEVSRQVLAPGSAELGEVVGAFGEAVLDERGALRRRVLGRVVFGDAEARRRLEAIVHPAMVQRMSRRLAELRECEPQPRLVVIEAANLVEMGAEELAEVLVKVTAPREERLRRLMARDGLSREEAEERIGAQELAGTGEHEVDRVIDAGGDVSATRAAAERLWHELVEDNKRGGGAAR